MANQFRVKVYLLDDASDWTDKGVGALSFILNKLDGTLKLLVVEEVTHSIILDFFVPLKDIFRKQQDSLIVWSDIETGVGLAVSFQDESGCDIIWALIRDFQGLTLDINDTDNEICAANIADKRTLLGANVLINNTEMDSPGSDYTFNSPSGNSPMLDYSVDLSPEEPISDNASFASSIIPTNSFLPMVQTNDHSIISNCDESQYNETSMIASDVILPDPTLSNLVLLAELFNTMNPYFKSIYSEYIYKADYFEKLICLFDTCEDLENTSGLNHIFEITKCIILMNQSYILEYLTNDMHIDKFFGILEYDPGLTEKQNHRSFFKDTVVFNQLIPFNNQVLLAKIHDTYKMKYLKDVVLPRILDDATFTSINAVIYSNTVDIVNIIYADEEYLSNLLAILADASTNNLSIESRTDGIKLLIELCHMARNLPVVVGREKSELATQTKFYDKLEYLHIIPILFNQLTINNNTETEFSIVEPLITKTVELISLITTQNVNIIRRFINNHDLNKMTHSDQISIMSSSYSYFGELPPLLLLTTLFLDDKNLNFRTQLTDIIKLLLDIDSIGFMDVQDEEKVRVITLFYSTCFSALTNDLSQIESIPTVEICVNVNQNGEASFLNNTEDSTDCELATSAITIHNEDSNKYIIRKKNINFELAMHYYSIIELITPLIAQHDTLFKQILLEQSVIIKPCLQLLACDQKFLALGALRLLRSIVSLKDKLIISNMVADGVFDATMLAMIKNGTSYNMMNSAVIELVDFVAKNNLTSAVSHICETYGSFISSICYVNTFTNLKIIYQNYIKNEHYPDPSSSPPSANHLFHSSPLNSQNNDSLMFPKDIEQDEEDWFADIVSTSPSELHEMANDEYVGVNMSQDDNLGSIERTIKFPEREVIAMKESVRIHETKEHSYVGQTSLMASSGTTINVIEDKGVKGGYAETIINSNVSTSDQTGEVSVKYHDMAGVTEIEGVIVCDNLKQPIKANGIISIPPKDDAVVNIAMISANNITLVALPPTLDDTILTVDDFKEKNATVQLVDNHQSEVVHHDKSKPFISQSLSLCIDSLADPGTADNHLEKSNGDEEGVGDLATVILSLAETPKRVKLTTAVIDDP